MRRRVVCKAPGKLILFGEHGVVYGIEALAISLSFGGTMTLESWTGGTFEKCMDEGPFEKSIQHQDEKCINTFQFEKQVDKVQLPSDLAFTFKFQGDFLTFTWQQLETFCREDLHEQSTEMKRFYLRKYLWPQVSEEMSLLAGEVFLIFIYDLWPLLQELRGSDNLKGHYFELTFRSELPIGCGLGSSAVFTSCLAAVLLSISDLAFLEAFSPSHTASCKAQVYALAFKGENWLHGQASGIDHYMSIYGGCISFKIENGQSTIETLKKEITSENEMNLESPMAGSPSPKLLIVNSGILRNSSKSVNNVKLFTTENPLAWQDIKNQMSRISTRAKSLLLKGAATMSADLDAKLEITADQVMTLEGLIRENQVILEQLGVSHPLISRILGLVHRELGWSGKMSGAGNGGCFYFLTSGDSEKGKLENLFDKNGIHMQIYEVDLFGHSPTGLTMEYFDVY